MPLWGKLAETWKHQKTLNQWMQSLQWGLNPLDQIQSKTMTLKEQCFQARKEASRLNTPAHEKQAHELSRGEQLDMMPFNRW